MIFFFSSEGPTDVDFRIKPDLVAPGVNVLSSVTNGGFAFFSGSSMASPHLAGAAAVVLSQHPTWQPWQVRSAITNTARTGKLFKYNAIRTQETDPLVTGAGLADVRAAIGAKVALSSVSTSFGAVPSGSGQSLSRTIGISSLTGSAQTLTWKITGDSAFGPATGTVQVPATGTATLTVTYNPAKAVAKGDHSAVLDLGVAHSVLYGFAK